MRGPTVASIEAGEFPRLHCARCDWQWSLHQEDAPAIFRINHPFVIPADVTEGENLNMENYYVVRCQWNDAELGPIVRMYVMEESDPGYAREYADLRFRRDIGLPESWSVRVETRIVATAMPLAQV